MAPHHPAPPLAPFPVRLKLAVIGTVVAWSMAGVFLMLALQQ